MNDQSDDGRQPAFFSWEDQLARDIIDTSDVRHATKSAARCLGDPKAKRGQTFFGARWLHPVLPPYGDCFQSFRDLGLPR